ncbi:MAG: class I SAM-dependent methyltransferase [Chromatiales bacterium]|nr:class I SAM-dependent methyltransferase [Chromatiales bacterium]
MTKKSQQSSTYDEMFEQGGFGGVFDLHYRDSCYYPMYKAVTDELQRYKIQSILEVGCGSGAFAHMLLEKGNIDYRGFDFSSVAVTKAIARTSRPDLFYVSDAMNADNYANRDDGEALVCTEVLEHIPQDLDLMATWPSGTICLCSVPNFDSEYHVRYFSTSREVNERYGSLMDIKRIKSVKKPILANISRENLLKHLRWNRYRPRLF